MNRLILRYSAGVLAALLVSFAAVTFIVHQSILRKMDSRAVPLAEHVFTDVRDRLRTASESERRRILDDLAAELDTGASIEPGDSPRLSAGNRALVAAGRTAMTVEQIHSGSTVFVPLGDGHVLAVGPLKPVFGPGFWDYVLMLLVVVIVVAVTATAMSAPFVRRLKRLEAAAVRIGQGDLSARADVASSDAVGSLARRFNEMADRNQQLLEAQRATLQAVSHELRTPTARIRFGLEMLPETKDPVRIEQRLRSIDEDLNEVDHLVTELLELNRSEAPHGGARESIAVRPALVALAERAREFTPALDIRVDAPADLSIPAEPHLFRRAIRNLLANAVRYARTRVVVTARVAGEFVEVAVDDDGPGVPEAQRVRVLEPFARLDDSRSRDTGGAGLGLAIVARVVGSHGGRVEVGESAMGGARFLTVWPAGDEHGASGT